MPTPDRHPRRKYGADQLRLVLCQIRYPVLHRFDEPEIQAKIQDVLRDCYPRAQQEQQVALTLSPSGPVPGPGTTLWRYQDLEGTWSVVVQGDAAGLETIAYDRYEDFAARLEAVLNLLERLDVGVVERIGLRYINELRHPSAKRPRDWVDLLDEEMLGIVGGNKLNGDIFHAIQDIRVTESNGTLVIRHGYVGPEPSGDHPYYLLDLDHFDETARSFDIRQIMSQLKVFHDEISDVFELSLTDQMRQHLDDRGPIDD